MYKVGIKSTEIEPEDSVALFFKFEYAADTYDFIKQAVEYGENIAIVIMKAEAPES